jgi:hypothetical protein
MAGSSRSARPRISYPATNRDLIPTPATRAHMNSGPDAQSSR